MGGPTRACLTEGSALRCQRGLSRAGWPRVPPHYPLTREIRFSGPFFTRSRQIGSDAIGTRVTALAGESHQHQAEAGAGTRHIQVHARYIRALTCGFPARSNVREAGASTATRGPSAGDSIVCGWPR